MPRQSEAARAGNTSGGNGNAVGNMRARAHHTATGRRAGAQGRPGPSRGALGDFYRVVQRVARERLAIKVLAARDEATQAIRADLEGRRLRKAEQKEQAPCRTASA